MRMAGAVKATALVVLMAALSACTPQVSDGSAQPRTASDTESAQGAEVVAFEWSADSDCAMCHTVEGDSMADPACAAGAHGAQQCADCHQDASGLQSAHASVSVGDRTPKRLKTTSVEESTCLACHGSYEELAGRTTSSTALTDHDGKVVNPHAIPENDDHANITCENCHAMHSSDPVADTAFDYCRSCHHADVFECGTCHE